ASPVNVSLLLLPMLWLAPPPTASVSLFPYTTLFRSLVDTVRLPVVGGGAAQLTENEVDAVPPAGTLTVREVPPLTEQFEGTPERATARLSAVHSVAETLRCLPMLWLAPPSTVTV